MAMSGCAAKLNKSIKTNIIEILVFIIVFYHGHTETDTFPATRGASAGVTSGAAAETHPVLAGADSANCRKLP